MKSLHWIDDSSFELEGVKFTLGRRGIDRFEIMKSPGSLDNYLPLQEEGIETVLGVGVNQAGSLIFLDTLLEPKRLVAASPDSAPIPELDDYALAGSGRAVVRYGVSPADIERIVDEDLNGSVDLIVNDGSYEHTKALFTVLFPKLRAGGAYIIEGNLANGDPALANIVVDLAEEIILNNSVKNVTMARDFMLVRKAGTDEIGSVFQGRGLRGRERVLI